MGGSKGKKRTDPARLPFPASQSSPPAPAHPRPPPCPNLLSGLRRLPCRRTVPAHSRPPIPSQPKSGIAARRFPRRALQRYGVSGRKSIFGESSARRRTRSSRGCRERWRVKVGGASGSSSGCTRRMGQLPRRARRAVQVEMYAAASRIFMSCSTSSVVPERWSTVRSGGG